MILLNNTKGNKNLFFIHDGSGKIEGYFQLARFIPEQYKTFGIAYEGDSSYLPRNREITDLAINYLQSIENRFPDGPYYIGGWSAGGTIAFEMSRQLEQRGKKAICFILDSDPPKTYKTKKDNDFSKESETAFFVPFIKNNWLRSQLEKAMDLQEFWRIMLDNVTTNDFDFNEFNEEHNHIWKILFPNLEEFPLKLLFQTINMIRTIHRAAINYLPQEKTTLTAYLFKAKQSIIPNIEQWAEFCSQLIIEEIAGDHYTILNKENVRDVSTKMNDLLTGLI